MIQLLSYGRRTSIHTYNALKGKRTSWTYRQRIMARGVCPPIGTAADSMFCFLYIPNVRWSILGT